MTAIIPIPKVDIAIRVATLDDIPFMDRLQKKYGKALGYFPMQQFVGYVESGGVLVAEGNVKHEDMKHEEAPSSCFMSSCFTQPLGYVISRDRYLKRDELGVVFQLCVEPGTQRKLVGAALVREVFARSAYGCRLYCCWCAQDLEANRFWESMGFLPIAFRVGSDKKRRVHIYWQRRIVEGDTTTPYWYPSLTNQGAIREDRLVFPIPPGMHWSEVRAVEVARASRPCLGDDMGETPMLQALMPPSQSQLQGPQHQLTGSKQTTKNKPQTTKNKPQRTKNKPIANQPLPGQVAILVGGRLKYVDRPGAVAERAKVEPVAALPAPQTSRALVRATPSSASLAQCRAQSGSPSRAQSRAQSRVPSGKGRSRKVPIDPTYVKAARELRDKYLERFNSADNAGLMLGAGKYAVARVAEGGGWRIGNCGQEEERVEDGGLRMVDRKSACTVAPSSILHLPSSSATLPSSTDAEAA